MSPPPVTPSPHRFIIKNQVRPVLSQSTPQSSAPQFKATPRFSFAASQRASAVSSQHVTNTSRFSRTAASVGQVSSCGKEDAAQYDHVTTLNERPKVDNENFFQQAGDEEEEWEVQSPALKRRRVSIEPILSSQSYGGEEYGDVNVNAEEGHEQDNEQDVQQVQAPITNDEFEDTLSTEPSLASPSPPAHRPPPSAPRFTLSTPSKPVSTPDPSDSVNTFLRPPRFKPPDDVKEVAGEPLPEHFSPRRRGQAFLAGGFAAEVRSWLVDRENQNLRGSRNPVIEEGWKVKIEVDEVTGGHGAGMTLIRGHRVSGNAGEVVGSHPIRMILGGEEGMGEGITKGEQALVGKLVGVKGPAWDIEIDGVRWGVSASWKVLS